MGGYGCKWCALCLLLGTDYERSKYEIFYAYDDCTIIAQCEAMHRNEKNKKIDRKRSNKWTNERDIFSTVRYL